MVADASILNQSFHPAYCGVQGLNVMTLKTSSSMRTAVIAAFLSLLCSCTHQPSKSNLAGRSKNRRANEALQRAFKKQQSVIEELREKNLVLEQRLGSGTAAAQATQLNSPKLNLIDSAVQVSKPAVDLPANMNVALDSSPDQTLYAKVLDAYGRHNLAETQKAAEILVRSSRDSIHADNALYLTGRLALESLDRPLALKYMNRILHDYPRGNKTVGALFLRAVIQKQMGQFAEAKQDLTTLARVYPGSPEAQRVRWELKTFATDNGNPRSAKTKEM